MGNKETGMWEKGTLCPMAAPSMCSELEAPTQSEQDTEGFTACAAADASQTLKRFFLFVWVFLNKLISHGRKQL